LHFNDEDRSLALTFAFDSNLATHLLNEMLANTQAKPCPLIVQAFLVSKLAEIHKQLGLVFLTDSFA
jgi:hypothetical protein